MVYSNSLVDTELHSYFGNGIEQSLAQRLLNMHICDIYWEKELCFIVLILEIRDILRKKIKLR